MHANISEIVQICKLTVKPDKGQVQICHCCCARFCKYMQIYRKFKPCKEMQSNMQITNTFQIAQLCACKPDQGQVQMGSCCSDANSGKEGAKRLMPPVKF